MLYSAFDGIIPYKKIAKLEQFLLSTLNETPQCFFCFVQNKKISLRVRQRHGRLHRHPAENNQILLHETVREH